MTLQQQDLKARHGLFNSQHMNVNISDLKIGNRFRKDFGDTDELMESIKTNGLLCPITITRTGLLIAGLRRIQAFKKLGLSKIPAHTIDIPLRQNGEIDENLIRKNFTVEEVLAIKRYRESIEPNYQGKRTDKELQGNFPRSSMDRREKRIAKGTGYSYKTLNKLQELVEAAKQYPKQFGKAIDKIDRGVWKVDKPYLRLKGFKLRKKLALQARKQTLTNDNLICGDFREVCKTIPTNSIDMIFTDPPYAAEYLPLYSDLAKVGERVLKIGGSLMVYAGNLYLPQILNSMVSNTALKYWWICSMRMSGENSRIHSRKGLRSCWKPLVWFIKGCPTSERPYFVQDEVAALTNGQHPDKKLHEWAQGAGPAGYYINCLTVENEIVLDPMLGSGTTGIAALELDRRFIGIEKDRGTFKVAKGNIACRTSGIM